jgi:hypothetical protein
VKEGCILEMGYCGTKKNFLRPIARLEKAGASTTMAKRNRALYVIVIEAADVR